MHIQIINKYQTCNNCIDSNKVQNNSFKGGAYYTCDPFYKSRKDIDKISNEWISRVKQLTDTDCAQEVRQAILEIEEKIQQKIRRIAPREFDFIKIYNEIKQTHNNLQAELFAKEWNQRLREEVDVGNTENRKFTNDVITNIEKDMFEKIQKYSAKEADAAKVFLLAKNIINRRQTDLYNNFGSLEKRHIYINDMHFTTKDILKATLQREDCQQKIDLLRVNSRKDGGISPENMILYKKLKDDMAKWDLTRLNHVNLRNRQLVENRIIVKASSHMMKKFEGENNIIYESYLALLEGKTPEEVPSSIIDETSIANAKKLIKPVLKSFLVTMQEDIFIEMLEKLPEKNSERMFQTFPDVLMNKFIDKVPKDVLNEMPKDLFIAVFNELPQRTKIVMEDERDEIVQNIPQLIKKLPSGYIDKLPNELAKRLPERITNNAPKDVSDKFVKELLQ